MPKPTSPDVALAYTERLEAYVLGFDVASERGTRHDHSGLYGICTGRSRKFTNLPALFCIEGREAVSVES